MSFRTRSRSAGYLIRVGRVVRIVSGSSRSALTRNFAELRDSLGISSDVTLHGLRKYVYAELISKEPRAFLVSRLVGHTVPAMMKVYGGLGAPKDLKEVIDKLDDL